MQYSEDSPVKLLPGVGPARVQALERLGITNFGQLVRHFPRGYQFRGNVKKLSDATPGETASFILTVATDPSLATLRRGMTLVKLRGFDESGTCELVFFNQPYLKDTLVKGNEYRFFGKYTSERGKPTLNSPIVEPISPDKPLPNLVAVYPLTAGITQKFLSNIIKAALTHLINTGDRPDALIETLPDEVRRENDLCALGWALQNIHFPSDFEALNIAKRRLIFEELYNFALGAAGSRSKETRLAPKLPDSDIKPLTSLLPFELTGAQKRAIAAISADLAKDKPMRRLVSGDVGSGKTAVAAAAAYIAVKNGFQCALMAPTEILATQHYNDLEPLFERLGITVKLLIGSVRARERKPIYAGLSDGSVNIVIGTHALIADDVNFRSLGLVICDEQHRFGVGQREALIAKGSDSMTTVHQLTMSATPIPRTLAMFLYGDLDMSVLDEMPPGRQRVKTFVVNESYRARLNAFIHKQHDEGHQTYVVCPAVEESESGEVSQEDIRLLDFDALPKDPPKAATVWANELQAALPDLKIGCVHGRMKSVDKDLIMSEFAAGNIDVLVSTTVIEVGVNVPNATLMIIENAERFGLSQLHQLRGRVGRGKAASNCVLVSECPPDSKAGKRLDVMRTTYDGFRIAEFDLGERGPGDFIPKGDEDIKQHGVLRFRLANLCEDMQLLEAAVKAAKKTAESELRELPESVTTAISAAKKAIEREN